MNKPTLSQAWESAKIDVFNARAALEKALNQEKASRLAFWNYVSAPEKALTGRQRTVLDMVRNDNLTNKEIANRLNISERTAKFHISALLAIFNVTSRNHLARITGGPI